MIVERETAGFALPFIAGVLLAAYSGYGLASYYLPVPIAASLSAVLLMHPIRRRLATEWQWLLIIILAFSAGAICGLTSAYIGVCDTGSYRSLTEWAEGWGLRMQEAIDRLAFRDKNCNAVAKALITGERCDITKETVMIFRKSGASHILALSGLHLGIIYSIITRALSFIGNDRRIWIPRSVFIICVCGFYTLATGAGASIVRAYLFICLSEFGRLADRQRSTAQLFFAAIIIQSAISPSSVKTIGFQLSYAAMAGIAFILPWLKSFWPGSIHDDGAFTKVTRKIWDACAMSISCQITTAPLAYIYFGTVPSNFLLANLLALPLTGMAIPCILAALALDSFGICPVFVTEAVELLILTLVRTLEIISAI